MGKHRQVRSHTFNRVRFHIGVDDPYIGWCDNPDKENNHPEYPAIRLPLGLPCGEEPGAKTGLATLIHECLHAEDWSKTEPVIDRTSVEIADLLWRLGYRRIKK